MKAEAVWGIIVCLMILLAPPVLAGDTLTVTGTVVASEQPVANFTADPVAGPAPLPVQFTDLSENANTSYAWDFESDGIVDATDQNPAFTYTLPGTYTVTLTVGNGQGSDTLVREDYITVTDGDAGGRIEALIEDVNGLEIPPGIKSVLRSELSLALWACDAGNPDWAASYLRLFIRTVSLMPKKILPGAESAYLTEEAQEILLLLQ